MIARQEGQPISSRTRTIGRRSVFLGLAATVGVGLLAACSPVKAEGHSGQQSGQKTMQVTDYEFACPGGREIVTDGRHAALAKSKGCKFERRVVSTVSLGN